ACPPSCHGREHGGEAPHGQGRGEARGRPGFGRRIRVVGDGPPRPARGGHRLPDAGVLGTPRPRPTRRPQEQEQVRRVPREGRRVRVRLQRQGRQERRGHQEAVELPLGGGGHLGRKLGVGRRRRPGVGEEDDGRHEEHGGGLRAAAGGAGGDGVRSDGGPGDEGRKKRRKKKKKRTADP
ncbi:hypothetical protein THAOC_03121, partial [Thalassiosira oceanica]